MRLPFGDSRNGGACREALSKPKGYANTDRLGERISGAGQSISSAEILWIHKTRVVRHYGRTGLASDTVDRCSSFESISTELALQRVGCGGL